MTTQARSGARVDRTPGPSAEARPGAVVTALAAWAVPGAGHLLQGQAQKAAVFAITLLGMFAIGLGFGGRLFGFESGDPLVFLGALAEWASLAPRLVAALFDFGRGDVVAATYEYGNSFLIASGLLNMLVLLDAVDLAYGRKAR